MTKTTASAKATPAPDMHRAIKLECMQNTAEIVILDMWVDPLLALPAERRKLLEEEADIFIRKVYLAIVDTTPARG